MTFQQLYSGLIGYVPKLSPQLAKQLTNQGWRDVRDSRLWSFNTRETSVLAPALTSTGTVTVTQYSNLVTFDAAATTAINTIPLQIPVTAQQFRIGSSGGPVYSIESWNSGTGVATLDRVYAEATATGQSYQIYKCYYPAPEAGFVRWTSFFDPIQAYPLKLHWSKPDFDRVDPQRGAQGNPYYVGWYRQGLASEDTSKQNLPLFELWPHPVAQIGYMAEYEVRGADLSADTDTLPYAIPDDLVTRKARWRAYEWCAANAGSHPELQKSNWLALMKTVNDEYDKQLKDVIRSDTETFLTTLTRRNVHRELFINTGQYVASHDIGENAFVGG